jgi:choline dehydrogenase-like flavoprotein
MTNNTGYFTPDEQIDCDISIIGGGAAGITIARELIGSSLSVCLVESGTRDFEEETQDLYKGSVIGVNYRALDASRLRFFGGTTNHWTGMCAPFERADFAKHEWIKDSGWPIDYDSIIPYYARAQKVCELGPFDYKPANWLKANFPAFNEKKLSLGMWQISPPTVFGERYGDELNKAENIRLIFNANLMSLNANEPVSQISTAVFRSLDGRELTIRAKKYVLACGGIENARMLLLSKSRSDNGLGNDRGLVGRYFMEHLVWAPAAIMILNNSRNWWHAFLPNQHRKQGVNFFVGLGPGPEVRKRMHILNLAFMLYPHYHSVGSWSVAQIKNAILEGRISGELLKYINLFLGDASDVFSSIMVKLRRGNIVASKKLDELEMLNPVAQVEQAPNPASRVVLTHEKDKLGLNKVALDWRLSEIDKKTFKVCALMLAEELGRLELGRVHISRWLNTEEQNWPKNLQGGNHHMGTTRMSNNPDEGVVDPNCRVHGITNLFVAGSSVFSTGGAVNPTLTSVALAIRLADNLKKQLRK